LLIFGRITDVLLDLLHDLVVLKPGLQFLMDFIGNGNIVDDLRVLIQNLHGFFGLLVLEPHSNTLKPFETFPHTDFKANKIFMVDRAALDLF
jgi:hypothetical protein